MIDDTNEFMKMVTEECEKLAKLENPEYFN